MNASHNPFARISVFALCLLALCSHAAQAVAATPQREGFTLELGIGGAYSHVSFDDGSSLDALGNSTLTLRLAVEVIPEFFDSRSVVATALNFEWQRF